MNILSHLSRAFIVLTLVVGLAHVAGAQSFNRNYQFVHSGSYVQDKNFYLFTLFNGLPQVNKVLAGNSVIKSVSDKKNDALSKTASCKDVKCYADAYMWSDDEISQIGNELKKLAQTQPAIKQLVKEHMRPSGYFMIYDTKDDGTMLQSAWADAAEGINRIIKTYALAIRPKYYTADSVSYDVRTKDYLLLVSTMSEQIAEHPNARKFYTSSLEFALDLLEVNNRNEAGRFEPMEEGQNKAAVNYIKTIDWKKYKYSVMLVPGAGNEIPGFILSGMGKIRLKIAADRYRQGISPIIVVSGGYVHPFQTPYCEAYEMKKYLINHFHIPEKAILIDPHARHTTTNIRDVNRLIYRYGIPAAKTALIVTDRSQSAYIEAKNFEKRCMTDMRCIPFKNMKRTSPFDLEYMPDISSLYMYSIDPLDP